MAHSDMTPGTIPASGSREPVGPRLMQAREAAGMTLPQLSGITKIPTRMLALIEAGDFAALPSRTYATGFTRSYARALGLDEVEFVNAVRSELGLNGPIETPAATQFEPGDPARVPTARLAGMAALAALLVVLAGLFLWRTYYSPAVTLPSLLPDTAATAEAQPADVPVFATETAEPTAEASAEPTVAAIALPPVARRPAPVRVRRVPSAVTAVPAASAMPAAASTGTI